MAKTEAWFNVEPLTVRSAVNQGVIHTLKYGAWDLALSSRVKDTN